MRLCYVWVVGDGWVGVSWVGVDGGMGGGSGGGGEGGYYILIFKLSSKNTISFPLPCGFGKRQMFVQLIFSHLQYKHSVQTWSIWE